MISLAISLTLLTSAAYCMCPEALQVKISSGSVQTGRSVTYGNVSFAEDEYFQKDGDLWACPCSVKACIRKCCPASKKLAKGPTDLPECVPGNEPFQIDIYEEKKLVSSDSSDFFIIYNMICPEGYKYFKLPEVYIQKNGVLFEEENITFNPDMYCLGNTSVALFCAKPVVEDWPLVIINNINVILSTICFAITAVIYWLILNENIILKKCIILFSSSMCVVFISLIVINVQANVSACRIFGFSFLTMTVFSFLWLPISCIELFYLVFIVPEHKQKKCRWYYYVGVSSAISILILTVSLFSGDTWVPDIPNTFIRHPSSCTYNVEYKRTFILFVPMILSFALSVIFIIMTTKWIRKRDNQEEIRNTYYWIQNRNNYKFMCRTYMVIVFASLLWCAHLFYYHDGTQLTLDVLEAALGIVTLAALVLNKYTRKEISSLYRKKPTVTAESLNMGAMGSPTTPDYESNPFFSNNHSNGSDQPNNR